MAIIEMNCNRLVLILRLHECNGRLNSPDSFIVTLNFFSHDGDCGDGRSSVDNGSSFVRALFDIC
jgi:hypothetical protein